MNFDWILQWTGAIFGDLWEMCCDVVLWTLEMCLGIASSAVAAIGAIPGSNLVQQYWVLIPVEARDLALRLGAGEITTIIVTAISVRIILQLIPFVRLGS